ncbi:hypothetical protein IWQ60_009670 [Tieghemiomyces parasiticus]|uniref:Phosphatidic acid phosphatase type 2/haloperoxidase domain-containing protein n=1 Tax=Tieghemiomyces parasiticus TaxID=78921 RepID=A0A9W7ZM92_9FUNG|nr:hypothetical protein IWQ60_009670 [Tieghemiomyces parasiticus]
MFWRSGDTPRSRTSRLIWSYAPDWLVAIIFAVAFFAIDKIAPFHRQFSLDNKSIMYPHKPDTISPSMLIVIAFAVPVVFIFVISVFVRRSWFDLHQGWLGCVLALALTIVITDTLKITVGRHRPDFISRCQIDISEGVPTDPPLGLSSVALCTQKNLKILYDGMKSFPSGHSSLSFAGMTFLSLYLAGKLHLYDRRGHTLKAFIVLIPLLGAALVAVSRTVDYRHHWQDVLVGSLIGIATAYFSYRHYYPSLSSPIAHRPYSPRIPADDAPGMGPAGGILPGPTGFRPSDDADPDLAFDRDSPLSGRGGSIKHHHHLPRHGAAHNGHPTSHEYGSEVVDARTVNGSHEFTDPSSRYGGNGPSSSVAAPYHARYLHDDSQTTTGTSQRPS